ncbi:lactonase [Fragilaria crotonensis]|nr:lactonase [Fragilaria crotonensis]
MQLLRSLTTNSSDSGVILPQDSMEDGADQLFFVTSYSDFDKLAHGPRGTQAKQCIYVFRFHPSDGSMLLLNKFGNKEDVMNPAFSRFHPKLDVVYTCTENCLENGQVVAYKLGVEGQLEKIGQVDAGGTSTCYLTLDHGQKNMLVVNYWNSTLAVVPLDPRTGNFAGPIHSIYDPNEGKDMKAAPKKKVPSTLDIGYVVNELSSTIAVFAVDRQLLQEINLAAENGEPMERFKGRTTLRLIQSIKTIPAAFSTTMNTCGRICVHKNGRFVIVSNRGHESIAIFRVRTKGPNRGQLGLVGYYHTRGETPRHFQFDSSGQFLVGEPGH